MVCSIGLSLKSECSPKNQNRSHFTAREWILFKLRSGVQRLQTVCKSHEKQFGQFFAARQKECCNPLNCHGGARKKNLKIISSPMHDRFHEHINKVVEGRKICIQCSTALRAEVLRKNLQDRMSDQETRAAIGKNSIPLRGISTNKVASISLHLLISSYRYW